MWNLWTSNTPPKVQNFIWRACSDILPTRANLLSRKVQIDSKCTLSGQCDKTTSHIPWECPFACNVWALAWGKLQKSSSAAPSFYSLTQTLLERLSEGVLERWEITPWSLWNPSNRFHFEHFQTIPDAIL